MSVQIYDEIEIEDLDWKAELGVFYYNCPCGDKFTISLNQLMKGEDVAECPSCTLRIRIIYQRSDLKPFEEDLKSMAVAC